MKLMHNIAENHNPQWGTIPISIDQMRRRLANVEVVAGPHIGSGGTASVFVGFPAQDTSCRVAVKLYHAGKAKEKHEEMEVLAMLMQLPSSQSRYVLRYFGCATSPLCGTIPHSLQMTSGPSLLTAPTVALVTEFITGGSWSSFFKQHADYISGEHLLCWLSHLMQSLAALHGAGYVHRDVKAANVFMRLPWQQHGTESGGAALREAQAILGDYGETTALHFGKKYGKVIGTPGWCAPEIAESWGCGDNRCDYTPSSDVWSAGVLFFTALTAGPESCARGLVSLLRSCHTGPESQKTLSLFLSCYGSLPQLLTMRHGPECGDPPCESDPEDEEAKTTIYSINDDKQMLDMCSTRLMNLPSMQRLLRERWPEVPDSLLRLVDRMMAKKADARPSAAQILVEGDTLAGEVATAEVHGAAFARDFTCCDGEDVSTLADGWPSTLVHPSHTSLEWRNALRLYIRDSVLTHQHLGRDVLENHMAVARWLNHSCYGKKSLTHRVLLAAAESSYPPRLRADEEGGLMLSTAFMTKSFTPSLVGVSYVERVLQRCDVTHPDDGHRNAVSECLAKRGFLHKTLIEAVVEWSFVPRDEADIDNNALAQKVAMSVLHGVRADKSPFHLVGVSWSSSRASPPATRAVTESITIALLIAIAQGVEEEPINTTPLHGPMVPLHDAIQIMSHDECGADTPTGDSAHHDHHPAPLFGATNHLLSSRDVCSFLRSSSIIRRTDIPSLHRAVREVGLAELEEDDGKLACRYVGIVTQLVV